MFSGITEATIEFFLGLRFNNNAAFFEANRQVYQEKVQAPLKALAEDLAPTLLAIDPQFDTRPARVVSRIRRDTRFSKNKDPYRDHLWLAWRYAGEATGEAVSFYFEMTPETARWGFGMYADNKPAMDMIRRRMVAKPGELLALLKQAGVPERFTIQGEQYKRLAVPAELPETLHSLYLCKGFYLQNAPRADDFAALYSDKIVHRLQEDFQRLAPLYKWLKGDDREG